jgi:hypothetical protein
LRYSPFFYANLTEVGCNGQDLLLSVIVINGGIYNGTETVLFFTFDEFRSVIPEYKRLRAYRKVFLAPGESAEVKLTVPAEDLEFVGPNDDSHTIIQPDMRFSVGVGAWTDCRAIPAQPLCVTVEPPMLTDPPYSGACTHACNIWMASGCAESFCLTPEQCMRCVLG